MKIYTIRLDENDIKALGVAIGELPTKIGMPLAVKINGQMSEQQTCEGGTGLDRTGAGDSVGSSVVNGTRGHVEEHA